MRSLIVIFFALAFLQSSHGLFQDPRGILHAGKNVTTAVLDAIPSLLPSPQQLFNLGVNALAGYPAEFIASVVNNVCSVALNSSSVTPAITPDINNMSLLLITEEGITPYPLTQPEEILQNPAFNKDNPTVILVTGWRTELNSANGALVSISQAYLCRGNVNFICLDSAQYIDTLYIWSALNTVAIGEALGSSLVKLVDSVPLENFHLIGHSLGAQIVGEAGRTFREATNRKIPRITGLDPASPCFNYGEVLTGIQRGDAEFLDIIHTNPGVLGQRDPSGDADFYPGGLSPIPNGCFNVICAHERSYLYYAESVYPGNENNFLGVRCTSLARVLDGRCHGQPVPMGYAVPTDAVGNFFLNVNSESPFGQNAPSPQQPQQCYNNNSTEGTTEATS